MFRLTLYPALLLLLTIQTAAQEATPRPAIKPVTEAMLRQPAHGDWLNWRRTDRAWGYSPLTQINKDNVGRLQLAWSWAMDDTAAGEAAPLVHDGIIYLPNPYGVIQALDGASGDLLWQFTPEIATREPQNNQSRRPQRRGTGSGVQKNIAIYGDKVFGSTPDAHIFAVDAATGALVWDTEVADFRLGYHYTAGPIVVQGKLITGINGCGRYKEDVCFISAHDAETGKELWRTSTIAKPGEPGGDSWGDLPLRFRAGGDAWIAGSYDPQTNLIYWGTAQAKPWASAARGSDGDALYTNSTLALDPDSGEIQWYFQHLPAESHDMDEVFENILVDADGRKSLYKMGKIGILWQLDRTTGEFISATDLGYQNLVNVNPNTGEVRYRDGALPKIGEQINMCPSVAGLKSWRAMAYSPDTHTMYIPLNLNCALATFGPVEQRLGGGGVGPVRRINYFHPQSGNNLGEFVAMDLHSNEIKWRFRTPSPMNTAALTTAGGLVFVGDWDRNVYAFDDASGEVLWHTRLSTSAQGFSVSYLANGEQYVAIPAGIGGYSWSTLLPNELLPEIRRPNHGNALFVFRLPKQKMPASSEGTREIPQTLQATLPMTGAEKSTADGVFTNEQSDRGREAYAQHCGACHGGELQGNGTAPALTGESFAFVWGGRRLQAFFQSIKQTMPPSAPSSLDDAMYIDIVAYVLAHNDYPAGETTLSTANSDNNNILIESN